MTFKTSSFWRGISILGVLGFLSACPGEPVESGPPTPAPTVNCTSSSDCQGSNVCDNGDCVLPGVVDAPCYRNGTCNDGLQCLDDICIEVLDAGGQYPDAGILDSGTPDGGIEFDAGVLRGGMRVSPIVSNGAGHLRSADGQLEGTFILVPMSPVQLSGQTKTLTLTPFH